MTNTPNIPSGAPVQNPSNPQNPAQVQNITAPTSSAPSDPLIQNNLMLQGMQPMAVPPTNLPTVQGMPNVQTAPVPQTVPIPTSPPIAQNMPIAQGFPTPQNVPPTLSTSTNFPPMQGVQNMQHNYSPQNAYMPAPNQAMPTMQNNTAFQSTAPLVTAYVEYASFFRRFVASIIDSIVFSIALGGGLGFIIGLFTGIVYNQAPPDALFESTQFTILFTLVMWVLIIILWGKYGATPGKMMLGCKIVDAKTLAPPTYKQWIIRLLGYYLSAIILFIGYLTPLFSRRNQALHDMIAGTVVIKVK
jgi:uncharacterized RDD family membrane protein YckC